LFNFHFRNILLILFLFSIGSVLAQSNVEVGAAKEFLNVVKKAKPGTRIVLADGEYNLGGELKLTSKGTENKPIHISAKHRGKAKIIGDSHFILTASEHIVIDGLNFESLNGPAIELRGSSHIQITRNTFHLKETQCGSWVFIDGIKGDSVRLSHHNRIDHNLFEKKSLLGNFITIEGTMRSQPQVSQ
jgi:poly(beta-D-mannuronate) lyase